MIHLMHMKQCTENWQTSDEMTWYVMQVLYLSL